MEYLQKIGKFSILTVLLLLVSCTKEIDIVETNPCGYTFVSATLKDGIAVGAILDYNIDFAINKNQGCTATYKMKFNVIGGDANTMEFTHNGQVQPEDTYFTIADANFIDHLTVTGYDDNFSIKFTIENTEAPVSIQDKSININFGPFVISNPADTVVYSKQTAHFTSNLTGGGPGEVYKAKVKVVQNYNGPMGATGTLKIGGIPVNFDNGTNTNTEATVNVPAGQPLTVEFTPTNAPSGSFVAGSAAESPLRTKYKLTVTKNGVIKTKNFFLDCKRPTFDATVALSSASISILDNTKSNLTVDLNLLDGYDQDLTYDYSVTDSRITIDGVNSYLERNNVPSVSATHIPGIQTFIIGARNNTGTRTIDVEVINEFNYIVQKSINITINN